MDYFSRLPDEIIVQILMFCNSSDLRQVQRTCRRLLNIASEPVLWRRIWFRFKKTVAFHLPGEPASSDYQQMYRRLQSVISITPHFTDRTSQIKMWVEIGSKTSWVTTDMWSKRHPTVVAMLTGFSAKPYCSHCPDTPSNSCNHTQKTSLIGNLHPPGNVKMVNPLEALRDGNSSVYLYFLKHILRAGCPEIQSRQPIAVIFVESEHNVGSRKMIVRLMFEELNAVRICFVNKAVVLSATIQMDTCLVVDSGANNTVVTPVVKGEAQLQRVRKKPVGGTCVAHHLATSLEWKGFSVPVSSLDENNVKLHCSLPLSPGNVPTKPPITLLKLQDFSTSSLQQSTLSRTVQLESELHLAPEMMYVTLDLPKMILDSLTTFSKPVRKTLLSRIQLIGGNCLLNGFYARLTKDLKSKMVKYSKIINVRVPKLGIPTFDAFLLLDEKTPACLRWITREEYVIHGTEGIR